MLAAYAAKAWGWQRLFRHGERPAVLTLAAAGGAASVGGIALPGRCDEVIRVAVVRRCRAARASFGAVALSLFVLGLLDSAALTPLASVALGVSHVGGWMQAGLIVVAVAGVLAAAVVVFALPRLARVRARRALPARPVVGDNATPPREAVWAWGGVALSWVLRALAIFVLLAALGFGSDFALALAFVCASPPPPSCRSRRPARRCRRAPGAAILVASGVHTEQAVAFGIAAQALLIAAGARSCSRSAPGTRRGGFSRSRWPGSCAGRAPSGSPRATSAACAPTRRRSRSAARAGASYGFARCTRS